MASGTIERVLTELATEDCQVGEDCKVDDHKYAQAARLLEGEGMAVTDTRAAIREAFADTDEELATKNVRQL